MAKYKRSRQRERILELLQSTERHPTANWLYDELKDEFPNLSMGTIYRNLQILLEQGLIKKIDFGSTFDRFDANIDRHYHFICEECGSITDLQMPVDDTIHDKVKMEGDFLVNRHRIEFFGVCGDCLKKRDRNAG